MKVISSLFFLFVFSIPLHAQNVNFAWAKQTGGATGNESGNAIAEDPAGNIYTTGRFTGNVDFDPGPGVYNLTAGNENIFILKLDADGNFAWAKQFASSLAIGNNYGAGIAADQQGYVYITGSFTGTMDFDPGAGTFFLNAINQEIFLLKLGGNGNFVWAKELGRGNALGGTGKACAIELDGSGNIYLTGTYNGIGDFDPDVPAVFLGTSSAASFLFVVKLNAAGQLIWAKATEGGVFSSIIAMTLDNTGAIYITGGFVGITDFNPGNGTFIIASTTISSTNIFIFKWNTDGDFSWAKMMAGGPGYGSSIKTDHGGNVYSTGKFAGTVDFDPGAGITNLVYTGTANIYISRLNSAGDYTGIRQIGGNSDSEGTGILLDDNGNVYITGTFSGTVDFDPGTNVYNLNSSGDADIFVAKIHFTGNLAWAVRMGGTGYAKANAMTINAAGDIYTTGWFNGDTDFDFRATNYLLTSNGLQDAFIHKITSCPAMVPSLINASACNSYTLNGQVYTATGIYTQILTGSTGCDSVINLDLIIGATSTSTAVSACESYSWNGNTYTGSGTYSDTLTNVNGCDSILTLDLRIGQKSNTALTATICPGENYNGHTITGIYTDYFTTVTNCDSTRILNLTVKNNCTPFSIPNAFSPNGDGLNDIFKPVITETTNDFSFTIFNRYGVKVFETKKYPGGWDGSYKGKIQASGSYIYFIRYKTVSDFFTEEKGTFLLLR